ncbi:hypothetical protein BAC7755_06130 [Bacillus sp. MN7755]
MGDTFFFYTKKRKVPGVVPSINQFKKVKMPIHSSNFGTPYRDSSTYNPRFGQFRFRNTPPDETVYHIIELVIICMKEVAANYHYS